MSSGEGWSCDVQWSVGQLTSVRLVGVDQPVEKCYEKDFLAWGVTQPKLIFSINGGAGLMEESDPSVAVDFSEGLVRAAESAGAWVITGGTDCGVMQLVGRAMQRYDLVGIVPCIGIGPYDGLKQSWQEQFRECVIESSTECPQICAPAMPPEDKEDEKQKKLAALEPNHTKCVMVMTNSNGVPLTDEKERFNAELPWREALEMHIEENGKIPRITILYNGGKGALLGVFLAMKGNCPIVVYEKSGRAADFIVKVRDHRESLDADMLDRWWKTYLGDLEWNNMFSEWGDMNQQNSGWKGLLADWKKRIDQNSGWKKIAGLPNPPKTLQNFATEIIEYQHLEICRKSQRLENVCFKAYYASMGNDDRFDQTMRDNSLDLAVRWKVPKDLYTYIGLGSLPEPARKQALDKIFANLKTQWQEYDAGPLMTWLKGEDTINIKSYFEEKFPKFPMLGLYLDLVEGGAHTSVVDVVWQELDEPAHAALLAAALYRQSAQKQGTSDRYSSAAKQKRLEEMAARSEGLARLMIQEINTPRLNIDGEEYLFRTPEVQQPPEAQKYGDVIALGSRSLIKLAHALGCKEFVSQDFYNEAVDVLWLGPEKTDVGPDENKDKRRRWHVYLSGLLNIVAYTFFALTTAFPKDGQSQRRGDERGLLNTAQWFFACVTTGQSQDRNFVLDSGFPEDPLPEGPAFGSLFECADKVFDLQFKMRVFLHVIRLLLFLFGLTLGLVEFLVWKTGGFYWEKTSEEHVGIIAMFWPLMSLLLLGLRPLLPEELLAPVTVVETLVACVFLGCICVTSFWDPSAEQIVCKFVRKICKRMLDFSACMRCFPLLLVIAPWAVVLMSCHETTRLFHERPGTVCFNLLLCYTCLLRVHDLWEFYGLVPRIKAYTHAISRLGATAIYSYFVLCTRRRSEAWWVLYIFLVLWCISLAVSEYRQYEARGKDLERYLTRWNFLDVFFIFFLMVSLLLDVFLLSVRLLHGVTSLLCWLRLLQIFDLRENFGVLLSTILRSMDEHAGRFTALLSIVSIGFSCSLTAIFYKSDETLTWQSLMHPFTWGFWAIFGEPDILKKESLGDAWEQVLQYWFGQALGYVMMVTLNVVLVNLLVAMLTNTFEAASNEKEAQREWALRRADAVLEFSEPDVCILPPSVQCALQPRNLLSDGFLKKVAEVIPNIQESESKVEITIRLPGDEDVDLELLKCSQLVGPGGRPYPQESAQGNRVTFKSVSVQEPMAFRYGKKTGRYGWIKIELRDSIKTAGLNQSQKRQIAILQKKVLHDLQNDMDHDSEFQAEMYQGVSQLVRRGVDHKQGARRPALRSDISSMSDSRMATGKSAEKLVRILKKEESCVDEAEVQRACRYFLEWLRRVQTQANADPRSP